MRRSKEIRGRLKYRKKIIKMGMKEKKREYARIEGKQNIRENKDEEEKEEEYVKELIHTMNKYDTGKVDDVLMKRKKRKKK